MNIKSKKSTIGILLASSSAIATGSFGLFVRYLDGFGVSENAITILTPLLAFISFFIIGMIINPKGFIFKKKIYWFTVIVLSGCIAFPLYNYTYVMAFSNLPLAIASIFHFSNAVILVFLMRLFFKQKITKQKIICSAIAIIGLLLVLQVFSLGLEGNNITLLGVFWGVAVAIALAVSYTVDYFNISVAEISWLHYQVYSCLFAVIFYSVVYYSPASMISEMTSIISIVGPKFWFVIIGYTIAIVVSYGAVGASYLFIDASLSSLTFVLEPTTGAILGYLVFGETLTLGQCFGIAIAIGAIVFMQYSESKSEQKALEAYGNSE